MTLDIDAAGYQTRIIDYCLERSIGFAIRAKMSPNLRHLIVTRAEHDWQPLMGRDGVERKGESVCEVVHTIGDLENTL